MKTQLIMPQEVEVFYVIPTVRRELSIAMKASGKKQKDIAKLLCVEESTISQYLSNKRASKFKLNNKVKEAVALAIKKIDGKLSLISETQKLLKLIKEENTLCEIHHAIYNIPKSCDVCFVK